MNRLLVLRRGEKKVFDGVLSVLAGPAQVPMMSPNGSVPPIYVPPGYVSQVWFPWPFLETRLRSEPRAALKRLVCFLSFADHRRERSAAGSGFTSAARVPPRGPLSPPPPSTSAPRPPACLHPSPGHDGPAAPPVHRHGRGRGRHELSVHLPVPSGSHLLRAGWGPPSRLLFVCLATFYWQSRSNCLSWFTEVCVFHSNWCLCHISTESNKKCWLLTFFLEVWVQWCHQFHMYRC